MESNEGWAGESQNRGSRDRWASLVPTHKSEQPPGAGDGQGSLVRCSPWGCEQSDTTERLNCLTESPPSRDMGKAKGHRERAQWAEWSPHSHPASSECGHRNVSLAQTTLAMNRTSVTLTYIWWNPYPQCKFSKTRPSGGNWD